MQKGLGMYFLDVLQAPVGWNFRFQILNGLLRVYDELELGPPRAIPVAPVEPGVKNSILSVKGLTLRLWPGEAYDDLDLTIVGLVPDEDLTWTVSRSQFNRLLEESSGVDLYLATYYAAAEQLVAGGRWIDEGFE